MVRSDAWRKRPRVTQYWAFKDELVLQAAQNGFKISDAYEIEFIFESEEHLWGKPHKKKPDLDNLVKAVQDCLWKSDQSIYATISTKTFGKSNQIKITCY